MSEELPKQFREVLLDCLVLAWKAVTSKYPELKAKGRPKIVIAEDEFAEEMNKKGVKGYAYPHEHLVAIKGTYFIDLCDKDPLFCFDVLLPCLLYTSPSPRDLSTSRMPSSA